jgi:hypothetical protein
LIKFNPEKLYLEFRSGTTPLTPIIPRFYTLSHSDVTAQLFLTIGDQYALDRISPMRDEVLAEWLILDNIYFLKVYLKVDGKFGKETAGLRNKIFRRELPLALETIVYGDRKFLKTHPLLNCAPIIVYFDSNIQKYNMVENWGTPKDYKCTLKQASEIDYIF